MPMEDPKVCVEFTKMSDQIAATNKAITSIGSKLDKLSRDFSKHVSKEEELEKCIMALKEAMPGGLENHKEYHEEAMKAKKAETEFYLDLKKTLVTRGIIGALILFIGLVWLGIEQWIKLHWLK